MRFSAVMVACALAAGRMSVSAEPLLPGIDPRPPAPGAPDSLPEVRAEGAPLAGGDAVVAREILRIRLEGWDGGGAIESVSPVLQAERGLVLPAAGALSRRLEKELGGALTVAGLLRIIDGILVHYDRHGYPVVGVDAPQQDFREGTLVLKIEIGRIGRVGVVPPAYGDPDRIQDGLSLREGAVLERADIDRQMEWYGRSVFRRPRLFVSPGLEPATADILIGLEESRQWRVSVGYENSGPDLAGRDRWLVGAAGMTRGEHIIAWQAVLGMPVSSLQAHAVSWEIPFHRWQQSLLLDAAYAEVGTRTAGALGILENEGTSWSVSAGHKLILPRLGRWRQQFTSGLEVKSTDQFVLFGAGSFSPGEVRLVHGKLGWRIEREWDDAGAAFGANLIASPGGLIGGNDDVDFQAYDPRADSSYVIGRAYGSGWWSPWGDWRLGLRGAAQWSDSRLLPSEQFAAGGYQSVRGIGEREFFADHGWQASLEVGAPEWRLHDDLRLRGIAFLDHAWLSDRDGASSSVTGAGVGLRMRMSEFVDLRADHGWWVDGRGGRTHVGVTVRY